MTEQTSGLHTYCVFSPETQVVEDVIDGYALYGYGCYATEVQAPSKREAIRQAIKAPEMREWVRDQRSDRKSPFSGLKAELLHCQHGVCFCPDLWDGLDADERCPQCAERADQIEAQS